MIHKMAKLQTVEEWSVFALDDENKASDLSVMLLI